MLEKKSPLENIFCLFAALKSAAGETQPVCVTRFALRTSFLVPEVKSGQAVPS
jgi:hypothetical protein